MKVQELHLFWSQGAVHRAEQGHKLPGGVTEGRNSATVVDDRYLGRAKQGSCAAALIAEQGACGSPCNWNEGLWAAQMLSCESQSKAPQEI